MKIILDLPADVQEGLHKLAGGMEQDIEVAAVSALREMLIGLGFMEEPLLEEDSEVAGHA